MAEKKYSKYVKTLSFRDDKPGFYRQVASVNGKSFGMDFTIEYGAYWAGGFMGEEPPRAHMHDFDQVMVWLGADANDMGELGAEVELCLGEQGEKNMITSTTAVAVPKGTPHFPANITRMDRRFIYMEVSCTSAYSEKKLPQNKQALEATPITIFESKYRDNIISFAFSRKGAWSYGPRNRDDSGGYLAVVHGKDPRFDFMLLCESLKRAPYRFGPIPDKPHIHPRPEILNFIGTDLNDLSKLGGEVEISLGKEAEKHVITKPTSVIIPGGFPHCPLTITRVDKPFILMDVRPFGSEMPSPKKP
jgi:hypothetical protein